jgi:response regulator RpfG family c-di-GMP phosphodiesterase
MNTTKTILIIEDNPDSLNLYGEILRSEGFNVIETAHGKAALKCLEETQVVPDLILMDLTFPFMTAEEFVSGLRSIQSCEKIPIIVISGEIDVQNRTTALKANDFIQKPFDLEVFLSKVLGFFPM